MFNNNLNYAIIKHHKNLLLLNNISIRKNINNKALQKGWQIKDAWQKKTTTT